VCLVFDPSMGSSDNWRDSNEKEFRISVDHAYDI